MYFSLTVTYIVYAVSFGITPWFVQNNPKSGVFNFDFF